MHPRSSFSTSRPIGVDVLAKRNLLEFIQNINREKGVTVLITSHAMDELEQQAGRIQSDIINGL